MWLLKRLLLLIFRTTFPKVLGIMITLGDVFICIPLTILWTIRSKKTIPPITDHLLTTPGIILAKMIRNKTITSEKLVTTFIKRIKDVNPTINAVVEDRFTVAIEEAKIVDEIILNGLYEEKELEENYPLLGIPITIKESIAVTGMSNNAGLICSRMKACKDADIVRKIKDAGAIVTAVTNTPELCLNWECFNNITGRTSNPYDNRRTSGGSSGGEAALLSSAASVIGFGSDTLGSLRLPAHFCGIFSHKPTSHIISIEGHFPDAEEREIWEKVFTLGILTRYSIDLLPVLKVICKTEKQHILQLDKKVIFSELTIFYLENWGDALTHSVIPEILEAIHKTMKHFQNKYNTRIQKWEHTELTTIQRQSLTSLIAIKGIDDIFNKNQKKSALLELLKYFLGFSKHTFLGICYLFLHRYQPSYDIQQIRNEILSVEKIMSKTLGSNGVLICPTFPMEAPYHGQLLSKSYNNIYMSTFNSFGFPVTVCPTGISKRELPIGLQIVGKTNSDRITIAVAQEMDTIFGGWRLP